MHAELSPIEAKILEWLLPKEKPFYADVLSKLKMLPLVKDADGTIIFGEFDDDLAETIAIGEIDLPSAIASLRMEEAGEGAQLIIPEIHTEPRLLWTLSKWSPGDDATREIEMNDATGGRHFVFALSPARRVLWLHHLANGFNQLLPVTGLLVELARLKRTSSAGRLTHDAFFELAEKSSDDVLMEALLEYNKRARKFDASKVSIQAGDSKRTSGFNFFRK